MKNYVEANGGVSWTPVKPVTLKVGYRHVSVDGKDGRPNHTLVDGAYVGGGVTFRSTPPDKDKGVSIKKLSDGGFFYYHVTYAPPPASGSQTL